MSLGDHFQTIIYYEDTGEIREIVPNQYIKSRKALNEVLGLPESRGLKFFYIQGSYTLMKEDWSVNLGNKRKAPALRSRDGKNAVLVIAKEEGKYIFKNYKEAIFVFEGGLGDYMDQADVIIACRKLHPRKKITVVMDKSRAKALSLMEGFEDINVVGNVGQVINRGPRIEFSKINALGGEYKPDGKVGIYSAISGMENTAPRAKIILSKGDKEYAQDFVKQKINSKGPVIIALHTMSGNTNTKSIKPEKVTELLSSLLKNEEIYFLHFGGAGEAAVEHPRIIPLQGELAWEKVFSIMSVCDKCVCIDSAILHIAQHLNLPTVSFWGPTAPINILGQNPGVSCVETTLDCKGCNAYDCNIGRCMDNFDKKAVTRILRGLMRW